MQPLVVLSLAYSDGTTPDKIQVGMIAWKRNTAQQTIDTFFGHRIRKVRIKLILGWIRFSWTAQLFGPLRNPRQIQKIRRRV